MSHSMKLNVTRVHRSIPTYRRNLWIHRASVRRKPTSTLSRRFRFQAVKASTSSETVQVQTKTLAKLTPFSEKEATDPSGQPGTALHDPPLCGRPDYFGAHFCPSIAGVNFAVYSSNASNVWLVLFTEKELEQGKQLSEIELDPIHNRTGDVWHIALPKIRNRNLLYGYRMAGMHQEHDEPQVGYDISGQRYDESTILLDPYGTTVIGRRSFGKLGPDLDYSKALGMSRTWSLSASCVPTADRYFNWEGDQPLKLPLKDLVIYEMHVRGFTKHKSSRVSAPGTYRGLVEKLEYLKDLGINCIELMPIHEFNELEYYQLIPGTKDSYRHNFWGYSTVNFFSPMSRYSAAIENGGMGSELIAEFKTLVRECHKRGMEVLMDVVYNHTAEGNHQGPSLSFRGVDNRVYYMLAPGGEYYNYSGCGNTFNCNHPVVRRFILESLRYWVQEMHVDGFRFDLASILTRAHSVWHAGEMAVDGTRLAVHGDGVVDGRGHMESGAGEPTGTPFSDPALIAMISEDPILRNTKMIAEAWDCDGLNQVGGFPHYDGRWAEWNGTFRDVVRNFIKGTDGTWAGDFAAVICGSPNLYNNKEEDSTNWWKNHGGKRWAGGRGPMHSINFVTAHDGFSLADLVSFNEKHNEANGEDNNDGETHNFSWNSGAEGATAHSAIKRLRRRQIRNYLCALLLSHGVPMLLMGDEYGHSKGGNNNTYCHDDELNWFNWERAKQRDADLVRFVRHLTRFRLSHPELCRDTYVSGEEIAWHGEIPNQPDWTETSRLVAYSIAKKDGKGIYVAFNSSHLSKTVQLPEWTGHGWDVVMDTGMTSPYDVLLSDEYLENNVLEAVKAVKTPFLSQKMYPMLPYSCIVLVTIPEDQKETASLF